MISNRPNEIQNCRGALLRVSTRKLSDIPNFNSRFMLARQPLEEMHREISKIRIEKIDRLPSKHLQRICDMVLKFEALLRKIENFDPENSVPGESDNEIERLINSSDSYDLVTGEALLTQQMLGDNPFDDAEFEKRKEKREAREREALAELQSEKERWQARVQEIEAATKYVNDAAETIGVSSNAIKFKEASAQFGVVQLHLSLCQS